MSNLLQLSSREVAARQQKLFARMGGLAIYREGGLLALVQLQSIQANREGVGAELMLVQRLACKHKGSYVRKRWEIWSVWDYFNEESDAWGSSLVGWHLAFDRSLIAGLWDFCAKLPVRQAAGLRWEKVHEFLAGFDPESQPESARSATSARLLALSHQRHAEEKAAGLHDKGTKNAKGKKTKSTTAAAPHGELIKPPQQELFG